MSEFACGYVLSFFDDGEDEEQVLHIGTQEECEHVMRAVPAVSYNGNRPVKAARMVMVALEGER